MTTQRTHQPTTRQTARCLCTPTHRKTGIPAINCPRHGLTRFLRDRLVRR